MISSISLPFLSAQESLFYLSAVSGDGYHIRKDMEHAARRTSQLMTSKKPWTKERLRGRHHRRAVAVDEDKRVPTPLVPNLGV